MTIDDHNACPACPLPVRHLYAWALKVLAIDPALRSLRPEYEELHQAVEAMRPHVEAHHANQLHAFSPELAGARDPKVEA